MSCIHLLGANNDHFGQYVEPMKFSTALVQSCFINLSKNTAYILRTPPTRFLDMPSYYLIYKTSQQQYERLPIWKKCSFNFFLHLLLHCPGFSSSPDLCHKLRKYLKNHQVTRELLTSFLSCFGCHLHWLVESRWMSSSLRLLELAKTFSPTNDLSHDSKIWRIMKMLKSNEMHTILRKVPIFLPGILSIQNLNR